jgi:hypothetical protein
MYGDVFKPNRRKAQRLPTIDGGDTGDDLEGVDFAALNASILNQA